MGRRSKNRTASGEVEQSTVEDIPSESLLGKFDALAYQTKAIPRLKVIIVTDDSDDRMAEAKMIKHILRRDRIRSSIYVIGDKPHDGTIPFTEQLFSESVKASCATLVLNEDHVVPISLRTWMTGRVCVGLGFPVYKNEYIDGMFSTMVEKIHRIPACIRNIKAKCNKEVTTEITRSCLSLAEF